MEYLLELLQDSAIISNVISVVALGVLGIITKLIINSIGSINSEKTQLLQARTAFERIDKLAELTELTAKLYKDAVIGSNLSSTTKSIVLEDYSRIQNAYRGFVVEQAEQRPVQKVEEAKPLIQEVAEQAGQDILAQLREQLK
jgi:hypothetical protein